MLPRGKIKIKPAKEREGIGRIYNSKSIGTFTDTKKALNGILGDPLENIGAFSRYIIYGATFSEITSR